MARMAGCESAGDRFGFALEPRKRRGIGREMRREDLDRHVAIQAGIVRDVHFAHPACTEQREDLVRTKPRAQVERHSRPR